MLKVALLQMKANGDDQEANLGKADKFCREAAARGADIALMPEMWNVGYTRFDPAVPDAEKQFLAKALATDSSFVRHFADLAKDLDMAIAVTYLQAWPGAPRNTVSLFDGRGREVLTYAKVHTCVFTHLENNLTPGREFYVGKLDTRAGEVMVGAMICYDREQPESARILMLKGAELVLTPNACTIDELRLIQFRVRAMENVVGVAMANYPSPHNNGHSVAFDADAKCLVEAGEGEGIYMAEFDLDHIRECRSKSIWGDAFRRPSRYGDLLGNHRDKVWSRKDANRRDWSPSEK